MFSPVKPFQCNTQCQQLHLILHVCLTQLTPNYFSKIQYVSRPLVCLVVYYFSHTVEHKVNTQALELSEPTMNITEMTIERYEHPFKFSFCNCYITDWNSMPYLNFTS